MVHKTAVSLEQVEQKIQEKHGEVVHIQRGTYKAVSKPATFIDSEYGEFVNKVERVLWGHGHPSRKALKISKKNTMPLSEVKSKLTIVHKSTVLIKEETYKGVQKTATFIDSEYGEFVFQVSSVLKGRRHPQYQKLKRLKTKLSLDICTQTKVLERASIPYNQEIVKSDFLCKLKECFSKVSFFEQVPTEILEKDRESFNYKPNIKIDSEGKTVYLQLLELTPLDQKCSVKKQYTTASVFRDHSISLVQFYPDEVIQKIDIVKSILSNKIGLSKHRHFARKLEMKSVGENEAKLFFTTNHLMGYRTSRVIGLYLGTTLIAAMGFRVFEDHVEIDRFCTLLNSSCIGGFGKLLNYIKQFHPRVVSYCDLRYTSGGSYKALGFKDHGTTLGWSWTDGSHRFNRLKCKASPGRTENENAKERGWFKIYDAGQRKYVLDVQSAPS